MKKVQLFGLIKGEGEDKKEFLGTIYVNEKNELVVDVKRDDIREMLLKEINEEIEKYGGFLLRSYKTIKTTDEKTGLKLKKHISLGELQKPGDPKFLEALIQDHPFWGTRKFGEYADIFAEFEKEDKNTER